MTVEVSHAQSQVFCVPRLDGGDDDSSTKREYHSDIVGWSKPHSAGRQRDRGHLLHVWMNWNDLLNEQRRRPPPPSLHRSWTVFSCGKGHRQATRPHPGAAPLEICMCKVWILCRSETLWDEKWNTDGAHLDSVAAENTSDTSAPLLSFEKGLQCGGTDSMRSRYSRRKCYDLGGEKKKKGKAKQRRSSTQTKPICWIEFCQSHVWVWWHVLPNTQQ